MRWRTRQLALLALATAVGVSAMCAQPLNAMRALAVRAAISRSKLSSALADKAGPYEMTRSVSSNTNAALTPPPGSPDFSIGVGTACDSSSGPAKCSFNDGETFTLDFKLNALPTGLAYKGYDLWINFVGVSLESIAQTGAGVWPGCVLAGSNDSTPGRLYAGCGVGIGDPSSTYLGVLMRAVFQCPMSSTGSTITLAHGPGNTDLVDDHLTAYAELSDESLSVNCEATPATPTSTPTPLVLSPSPTSSPPPSGTPQPTDTSTPTVTPTRTPTRTPAAPGQPGDVNCSGQANSIDAALLLQFGAGLISSFVCEQNADVNHSGAADAIDAALVLQYSAGLIDNLPAGAGR